VQVITMVPNLSTPNLSLINQHVFPVWKIWQLFCRYSHVFFWSKWSLVYIWLKRGAWGSPMFAKFSILVSIVVVSWRNIFKDLPLVRVIFGVILYKYIHGKQEWELKKLCYWIRM